MFEVNQLFTNISYLASEVDDESIIIEQSLRESFFEYIDSIADTIFGEVLNFWADRVASYRAGAQDTFFEAA